MVVSFRMLILAQLIPAESSIVKSLEMLWVYYNCLLVVLNSSIKLFLLPVSEAPVVIEVSLVRLDVDCLCEAADS